jgi:hypothetical protein
MVLPCHLAVGFAFGVLAMRLVKRLQQRIELAITASRHRQDKFQRATLDTYGGQGGQIVQREQATVGDQHNSTHVEALDHRFDGR